jgi:hypothetical protein
MSKTNHGTIEIVAGGKTYTLKPTLRALREIDRRFGGVTSAMQALSTVSMTSIALIVAVGAGIDASKRKDVEAIEEDIFEAGLSTVGSQALEFLKALTNPSGKTSKEIEEEKEAASGNE